MSQVEFTIGADPELFLKKKGEGFSAHGIIPGTKETPFPVLKGAIQVDGMALEFNIDPVPLHFRSVKDFEKNIVTVLGQLKEKVKLSDNEVNFSITPIQEFSQEYFDQQPDSAKELGCDPDYNAYTGEQNPRPAGDRLFRTAAGHIHVGWGADIPADHPDHHAICRDFIKMMDATVGAYMTIIDEDSRRRELYGKAGAYRAKTYGVEYRTPSNAWLLNKQRRESVFHLTNAAVTMMRMEYNLERYGFSEQQIQDMINTGNAAEAYKLLNWLCGSVGIEYTVMKNLVSELKRRKDGQAIADKVTPKDASSIWGSTTNKTY